MSILILRAINKDKLHIIKKYHKLGRVNLRYDNDMYLKNACGYARMDIIDYLLENGASENKKVIDEIITYLNAELIPLAKVRNKKVIAKLVSARRKHNLKELLT